MVWCMTVFQHVFDDRNIVLAPFNVSGDHWELLAFYPSVRNIVYVNPLGEKPTRIKAILNAWSAITKRHQIEGPQATWKVTLRPHTRQQDGHSCGVLVMEVSAKRLTRHTAVCMRACVCVTYLRYFTSVFFLDMNSNLLTGTYKCNVHVCWVSEKQDLYKCFILRICV